MRGIVVGSKLFAGIKPPQAAEARDGLAKACYDRLFDWIVARINTSSKPSEAVAQSVGVLDIFGPRPRPLAGWSPR